MFLYTESALEAYGDITDAQMETVLATAITSSNEAMVNSDIDLELSVVYVGPVRFRDRLWTGECLVNLSLCRKSAQRSKIKHQGRGGMSYRIPRCRVNASQETVRLHLTSIL